ncbi:ribonuclease P/MRP protein subunit [Lipomyces japonicus]|uniref:ribonuclease P/MRP protein subunit n=1 Tax=Lipomyces japonicus TaxID=56871 RepID=UPI0034CECF16
MVRFKSRYILFKVQYPHLNDSDTVKAALDKKTTPISLSDLNFYPGGSLANLKRKQANESEITMIMNRPGPVEVTSNSVNAAMRDSINRNFGDLGAGLVRASVSLKYFSQATSTGIVRVSRDHYRIVWAALTLLNEIGNNKVVVSVIHVSGTIKKCENALIANTKQKILIN